MNSHPEKLQRILIAVEDSPYSDQAVRYGVLLGREMGSEIMLVHVDDIPVSTPYIADPMLNESPLIIPEMMQIQEEASRKLFERYQKEFKGTTEFMLINRVGRAQDEIVAVAEEFGADMIILGTHGRTGLDHFISGSVSESVARKANCPVLIIPLPKTEKHKKSPDKGS